MGRNPNREQTFRFKQFEVRNAASAMKVGTDGVLLGSWMTVDEGASVLDIGAGCGLISLMAAQRGAARVYGVEIDEAAADEAAFNVAASPWADRVVIVHNDFFVESDRMRADGRRFDLVVSNPPFFSGGVCSPDLSRSMARHGVSLDFPQLIASAADLLESDGHLALVSPVDRKDDIELAVALSRLHICRLCSVATKPGAAPIRLLWDIVRTPSAVIADSLAIGSPEYRMLTSPFYLDRL